MTDTSWLITWCISPLVTSYFHVYVLPCNCLFHSYTCTMPVLFLLLYRIPCLADPSWSLILGYFYVTTCHVITSDLSVTCFYISHVYHLMSDMSSPDYLTCHYLARPFCYAMTCHLLNIIILSCYHLTPSMISLTLWLSCLRESCLVILNGTKCHTEQSATSHTWWGPPLESVGAISRIHPLRTKCHTILGGGHLLNL